MCEMTQMYQIQIISTNYPGQMQNEQNVQWLK